MSASDGKNNQDLYERTLSNYRDDLQKDPKAALDRYGVTLLNSINPAERARALNALGVEIEESVDHYNLGVQAAQEENWTEAIIHFKRTVEIDPEMTDAIYNLAICYEKTGHIPQARSTWDVYVESIGADTEDAEKVREHLTELAD